MNNNPEEPTKKPSGSAPDPSGIHLQMLDAFEGVNQLVLFACRNALIPKDLDEVKFSQILGRISDARDIYLKGDLSHEKAVQFYNDYRALTLAFMPVSITSIRDTTNLVKRMPRRYIFWGDHVSRASATVRRFSICSIFALIALLYGQIIWVAGTSITTNIKALTDTASTTEKAPRAKIPPAAAGVVVDVDKDNKVAQDAQASGEGTESVPPVEQQLNREKQIKSFLSMLNGWAGWTWGMDPVSPNKQDEKDKKDDSTQIHNSILFANSIIALDIYKTYALPLLYGLMGACCYMLRRLIVEIRERTFRSDAEISYWLRLYLGMLAGLAIGWFLRPEIKPGATDTSQFYSLLSMTPLALSFIAGYSVELLFSAMDRLVDAFGSTSQKSPG